ncbi:MAG: TonB-dependent receptor [Janthinobacterium lividum]
MQARNTRAATRCVLVAAALLSALADPAGVAAAATDDASQEQVTVAGTIPPVSALSPDALQPASRLTAAFLRDAMPPTAAYDEIVRLTPGVVSVQPDGPGLGENAALTIRGFSDGQYNVTFDGIPFADTDDFTHHSTAYFAPQALGSVTVDRGPGTAATIGDATFGGTVSLVSIEPGMHPAAALSGTVASFDTRREGVRLDSGTLSSGGGLVLEAEHASSDGVLTGTASDRDSLFGKLVRPLDPDTTLTVAATWQRLHAQVSAGATRAEIAACGPDHGLVDDVGSQDDGAYNAETYRTDFAYAAVHRDTGTIVVDWRIYTYGLSRNFDNGTDPDGETPNGTALDPNDVPGQDARNELRAWGTVLRLERRWQPFTLRLGLWAEHQINSRGQQEVDLSRGGMPNPVLPEVTGIPGSTSIDRLQHDTLDTLQPYGEAEWRPRDGVSVVAGLRWAGTWRDVSAPVMEGTRLPTYKHAAYATALPSIAVRQHLSTSWSVYAQAAEGALAPQLQLLDTTGSANQVPPERTLNFQLGTLWQRPGLSLGLDGYVIQFDDLTGTRTVGADTLAFDEGGATYQGLEAEATIGLGRGLSLYGNASLSRARDHDTGAPVPNAPTVTLAGGLLVHSGAWSGSLLDKWVGTRQGDTDRQAGLNPFNQLDLAASWTLVTPRLPALRLSLQLQNLLDSRGIDALAGYTVGVGTPLWFAQTSRSLWLTATVSL